MVKKTKDKQKTQPTNGLRRHKQIACSAEIHYFRNAVKDHCYVSRSFHGAAHDECNIKLQINPKTIPILVVFHNLKGYDAHHLIQEMSQIENAGDLRYITNNMEKCISFSLGGL